MFITSSLHHAAAQLRENNQSTEALALYAKALNEYIAQDDMEGVIRVLLEKNITYQHLWFFEENEIYIELAANTVQLAEHLVNHFLDASKELRALVLQNVGQLTEAIEEPQEAASIYREALELQLPNTAAYANTLSHLAHSEWFVGDKDTVLEHFAEAVALLAKNKAALEEETYRVWLAGALLREAECLLFDNAHRTQELLTTTREVLQSPELSPIRWAQLEKIENSLETFTEL